MEKTRGASPFANNRSGAYIKLCCETKQVNVCAEERAFGTLRFRHLGFGCDRRLKIVRQIYLMGLQLANLVLFDTSVTSRTRLIQRSRPPRPSKTNPPNFLSKSYWPKFHSLIQEHMYYVDTFRASIIQ